MAATVKTQSPTPLRDVTREFSLAEASYVLGQGMPAEFSKLIHETRQVRKAFYAAHAEAIDAFANQFEAARAAYEASRHIEDALRSQRGIEQALEDMSMRRTLDAISAQRAAKIARQVMSAGPGMGVESILADVARVIAMPAHEFVAAELRYLKVAEMLGKQLSPAGRRSLYESICALPLTEHVFAWDRLTVDLSEVDKELSARIGQLEAIEQKVDLKAEGKDPVLAGTDFPVYVIAALTRGQTVDEILEDYPGLTADQVATAVEYEKAHPKIGRPYPTRSLKRGLAALDLSAINEFLDDDGENAEPGAPTE